MFLPGFKLLPAVNFQITAIYQLRPGLFRVRVLVASLSQFSGRSPCHSGLPQVWFPKFLLAKLYDDVLTKNVNAT